MCVLHSRCTFAVEHVFLSYLSLVFFACIQSTCVLCFQVPKMLRSAPSKATNTGLFESCVPECAGASRSLFFSKRDVCNVSLGFIFDLISSLNAEMQYRSRRVGKMQDCVSLLPV